ncbi:hypothetical protein RRG08_061594 [Elysia crispata]|uniref:Uncharacterized protein n=1 Tax=Elysia crispata TaxID=231223 RepID=A0AAE0YSP4_9GAST|nr:hypothetical protein RRG08_061594 [Elysia crispata]
MGLTSEWIPVMHQARSLPVFCLHYGGVPGLLHPPWLVVCVWKSADDGVWFTSTGIRASWGLVIWLSGYLVIWLSGYSGGGGGARNDSARLSLETILLNFVYYSESL